MTSRKRSARPTSALQPRIGITLGDPSGIGPEIVAKALVALDADSRARILLFGDEFLIRQQWDVLGAPPMQIPHVVSLGALAPADLEPGVPNMDTARAQVAYLESALAAARSGAIAGLATAPISKTEAMRAGFEFPGHTEFLSHGLDAPNVAMMFAGPKLNVVLATVHEAVAELPSVLTRERVCRAICLAAAAMRDDFGIENPRIGVLGLNPHAGEGGRFGDEESRVIEPAIQEAREKLVEPTQIDGPLVPDAAFRMPYDCFVAMYHDQGLIPVKLIDFEESVNTTLGLPIVRTSPDHGVAYDIAGKGIARATSMQAAIELAIRLVDQRATRRAIVS